MTAPSARRESAGLREVRFLTAFDAPPVSLEPPVSLSSGRHPAVQVVDGLSRGTGVVGRWSAPPALFGVRVDGAGGLRVRARVLLDTQAMQWWAERATAEASQSGDPRARLLLLRVDADLHAATLLVSRASPGREATRGVLVVDVPAGRVEAGGLLVLEMIDPPDAARHLLAGSPAVMDAAAGLRLDTVDLTPSPGAAKRPGRLLASEAADAGILSTGGRRPGTTALPLPVGAVVLNPPDEGSGWRLHLEARVPPVRGAGTSWLASAGRRRRALVRRARLRRNLRAALESVAGSPAEVVDLLTGATSEVRVLTSGRRDVTVVVEASNPVLVRVPAPPAGSTVLELVSVEATE